jgi:small subunit ribosomal protein S17
MSGLTLQGTVINKSDKTVKVEVTCTVLHPKYKKIIKRSKKYLAHSESPNEIKIGDTVKMVSCKPISRKKRWSIVYD